MNQLGLYRAARGQFGAAEPLFRCALAIDEVTRGPDHPAVSIHLNNLAGLLMDTNRLGDAEPACRRALAISEASSGPDHPDVARCLNNLARLLMDANRVGEAEPLFRRALAIDEASYGPEHPDVATCLNNLASLPRATNRLDVEILIEFQRRTGHEHPNFRVVLARYTGLLKALGRTADVIEEELDDLNLPPHPEASESCVR